MWEDASTATRGYLLLGLVTAPLCFLLALLNYRKLAPVRHAQSRRQAVGKIPVFLGRVGLCSSVLMGHAILAPIAYQHAVFVAIELSIAFTYTLYAYAVVMMTYLTLKASKHVKRRHRLRHTTVKRVQRFLTSSIFSFSLVLFVLTALAVIYDRYVFIVGYLTLLLFCTWCVTFFAWGEYRTLATAMQDHTHNMKELRLGANTAAQTSMLMHSSLDVSSRHLTEPGMGMPRESCGTTELVKAVARIRYTVLGQYLIVVLATINLLLAHYIWPDWDAAFFASAWPGRTDYFSYVLILVCTLAALTLSHLGNRRHLQRLGLNREKSKDSQKEKQEQQEHQGHAQSTPWKSQCQSPVSDREAAVALVEENNKPELSCREEAMAEDNNNAELSCRESSPDANKLNDPLQDSSSRWPALQPLHEQKQASPFPAIPGRALSPVSSICADPSSPLRKRLDNDFDTPSALAIHTARDNDSNPTDNNPDWLPSQPPRLSFRSSLPPFPSLARALSTAQSNADSASSPAETLTRHISVVRLRGSTMPVRSSRQPSVSLSRVFSLSIPAGEKQPEARRKTTHDRFRRYIKKESEGKHINTMSGSGQLAQAKMMMKHEANEHDHEHEANESSEEHSTENSIEEAKWAACAELPVEFLVEATPREMMTTDDLLHEPAIASHSHGSKSPTARASHGRMSPSHGSKSSPRRHFDFKATMKKKLEVKTDSNPLQPQPWCTPQPQASLSSAPLLETRPSVEAITSMPLSVSKTPPLSSSRVPKPVDKDKETEQKQTAPPHLSPYLSSTSVHKRSPGVHARKASLTVSQNSPAVPIRLMKASPKASPLIHNRIVSGSPGPHMRVYDKDQAPTLSLGSSPLSRVRVRSTSNASDSPPSPVIRLHSPRPPQPSEHANKDRPAPPLSSRASLRPGAAMSRQVREWEPEELSRYLRDKGVSESDASLLVEKGISGIKWLSMSRQELVALPLEASSMECMFNLRNELQESLETTVHTPHTPRHLRRTVGTPIEVPSSPAWRGHFLFSMKTDKSRSRKINRAGSMDSSINPQLNVLSKAENNNNNGNHAHVEVSKQAEQRHGGAAGRPSGDFQGQWRRRFTLNVPTTSFERSARLKCARTPWSWTSDDELQHSAQVAELLQ
eukprot:g14104.t1